MHLRRRPIRINLQSGWNASSGASVRRFQWSGSKCWPARSEVAASLECVAVCLCVSLINQLKDFAAAAAIRSLSNSTTDCRMKSLVVRTNCVHYNLSSARTCPGSQLCSNKLDFVCRPVRCHFPVKTLPNQIFINFADAAEEEGARTASAPLQGARTFVHINISESMLRVVQQSTFPCSLRFARIHFSNRNNNNS